MRKYLNDLKFQNKSIKLGNNHLNFANNTTSFYRHH